MNGPGGRCIGERRRKAKSEGLPEGTASMQISEFSSEQVGNYNIPYGNQDEKKV
jgi:hypothetical protein